MALEATPFQTMRFDVRPMVSADVNAAAELRSQTWETVEFWRSRIPLYLSGEHSPRHALPPRAAFVAVDNGSIVGFIAGHLTRRYGCDGELQWIDVDRDHRGRGIAGELLKAMAGWFVAHSALRICVDVDPQNAPARAFYVKNGAQPLNPHWMVWEDVRILASH